MWGWRWWDGAVAFGPAGDCALEKGRVGAGMLEPASTLIEYGYLAGAVGRALLAAVILARGNKMAVSKSKECGKN